MQLVLTAWLASAGPSAPPPEAVSPREDPAANHPLVLRVAADDFEPLRAALANRLPTVSVHPHRASVLDALRGRELYYAELVETGIDNEVRLVVILNDGRSFERNFTVDAEDRVHSIATTLANTIAAIREERIEPTRTDAEIPAADPEPTAPPEPAPAEPPPKPTTPVRVEPIDAPKPPPPPVRRYELGLAAYGGPLLGLAPRGLALPHGAAGLDVDLRLPIGVLVGIGARYATRQHSDVRVHRIAVTVGTGYVLRRNSFELRLAASLAIEPFVVTDSGTPKAARDSKNKPGGPLVGAIVSASPGWYWRRNEQSPLALRLGMRAQLQLSSLTTGGAANVRLRVGNEAPRDIARLGGAELMLGLDAGLWFTLAKAKPRARRG
jgi:hypothetical protein